jgi:uncharacterized protein
MMIDDELLAVMACPNCLGKLEYLSGEAVIACRGECGLRYPVRDGIPVMLIDEAEPRSRSDAGK